MTDAELKALADRLDRLERFCRRLKRLGGLVLVVAAMAVLSAQGPNRRVVRAEEFVLQDANGTEWGAWGVREVESIGPTVELVLSADNNHSLATLSAAQGGAHMTLAQKGGVSVDVSTFKSNRYPVPWGGLRMYGDSPDANFTLFFSPPNKGNRAAVFLSPGTDGPAAGISVDSTGALLASDPVTGGQAMRRLALQRP